VSRRSSSEGKPSADAFVLAAVTWAAKQRTGRASDKAVLMNLAMHVNRNTNVCYPSVAQLRSRTELDRKTVLAALGRLAEADLITDTGHRIGKTGQVKVWKLAWSYTPKKYRR
jgi:pyocin large subunit-like protein